MASRGDGLGYFVMSVTLDGVQQFVSALLPKAIQFLWRVVQKQCMILVVIAHVTA
jgi:hypothetical protein